MSASQQVSSLLGQYLLQGYCMLGSHCEKCGTVHMRSRDKTQVICVNCDILRTKVNSLQEDQVGNESQKTAEDFSIKSCEIQIQDNLPEIGRNQNPKGNEGTNLQKDDDDEMNESDTTESYDNQPPSQSARARRQPRREQYRHNHGDQLSMAAADTGSSFRPPSTEYNEISNSKNASFLYSASSSAQRRSMLMSPRISGAGELSVTLQQRFAHRESDNIPEMDLDSNALSSPRVLGNNNTERGNIVHGDVSNPPHMYGVMGAPVSNVLAQVSDTGNSGMDAQSRAAINQIRFRSQVAVEVLNYKLQQATELLERATTYEEAGEAALVITRISEALSSLKKLIES